MRTRSALAFLALIGPTAMGCAALFAPGPDMVRVHSKPSGATVFLDKVEMGRTPCIVAVPRSSEGVFTFEREGYETATVDRDKVCNGLTALNLLGGYLTMPLFFAIDALTGKIGKYSTQPIHVELKPVKPPPPTALPTLGHRPRWDPRRTPG